MDNNSYQRPYAQEEPVQIFDNYKVVENPATTKAFFIKVFSWMFVALGVTTLFAFLFATSPQLLSYLISETGGLSTLGMITMFAPLGFVLLMSFGFQRLSAPALIALFLVYAAITGVSFSFILLIYTASSVIGCFGAAAGMFATMAIMGYTTNKDLTSFGRIMMMGLIGIIIASVINIFLGSGMLDYIISFIGVAVFTGLTAYDVQKLKRISAGMEYEGADAVQVKKVAILGALTLYLDFINLFLMLLRLFGGRRD